MAELLDFNVSIDSEYEDTHVMMLEFHTFSCLFRKLVITCKCIGNV